MEFINEGIALGFDILIFGLCFREYYNHKKTLKSLREAPQLTVNEQLKDYVSKQKDKKIPYAIIRGTVTPMGAPIKSVMSPSVTGVLQIIKLSEHRVARGFAGFWTEQRKLIHVSSNEIPFMITNSTSYKKILDDIISSPVEGVEIVDALSAEILDLDVVYDNYEPSSLSFFDHIFGFFSGVRQKGLQTTEQILRDGSFITAVGELELDGKVLRMQSSSKGPLFLTTATKATLIKKFEEAKSSLLIKMFICGTISAVLIGIIGRRYYLKKKQERDERKLHESLEKARRERRIRSRNDVYVNEEQLCVVCVINPKEVIVLPCGHVCLCENCSEKIKDSCPVCRSKIENKNAAFIS